MATSTNCDRGGYDYSFVNTPPDELVCKICHHPSREPHLTGCCGHTFCKSCLDDAKRVKNACPMCREENFATLPNKRDERAVKGLHVFCTNKDKGCDWQGELNNIVGHLVNSNGCPFQEVSCTNECGLSLQRQYLSKHVDTKCPRSKVTCQYCSIIGERQFISGQHHEEECPKFPLPCPNKCEIKVIPRENMEAHRAECPLEMIQCEYYEIGCKISMARKDVVKHNKEEVKNHLSLMKFEYLQTKGKLADAEKRIRELESSMEQRIQVVENMMFKHVFQWHTTLEERDESHHTKVPVTLKMSDYSKMKKTSNCSWNNNTFSWELPLFDQYPKLKLRVTPAGYGRGKGTHLSVQLYLVKGGCKEDFIALEHQIECQLQSLPPNEDLPVYRNLLIFFLSDINVRTTTRLEDLYIEKRNLEGRINFQGYSRQSVREHLSKVEREIGKREKRERWEKEREELREKQKLWEKNSLAHLHVMILNQITDSEHYSVLTDQIDLTADHFLTNKECNVLIFDSPCFVSNEVLHKSTATCRYLQDDNVYFLIKAA